MQFRDYEPATDREAVQRIWRETGWLREGKEEVMDLILEAGRAIVAELNGEAECLVNTVPGTLRYLDADLPLSCVASVTTSRIARKQRLASRLTGQAVADDVAAGAIVSVLGMFEQGYYDRLGFGAGGYEYWVRFDPARLKVDLDPRVPRRLTVDDRSAVHANRLNRLRRHGACSVAPLQFTHAEMLSSYKQSFGLGYFDGPDGQLTHHVWFAVKDNVELGPYTVKWMAWQTPQQFRELLAIIKSLADQVAMISVREPAGIQWQDLIEKPFESQTLSRGGEYEQRIECNAYWQMRICDLLKCLDQTHLPGDDVRFNLRLTDPIERFLPENAPWRGVAGEYVVSLGPSSGARRGTDSSLPTLEASVNAFTRMWLGVRPATGLAITDDCSAGPQLLEQLDRVLRLPAPKPDWDF